jgi:hypothetical protein
MPESYIDEAAVLIRPILTQFQRDLKAGLDDAFGKMDANVKKATEGIEKRFKQMGKEAGGSFKKVGEASAESTKKIVDDSKKLVKAHEAHKKALTDVRASITGAFSPSVAFARIWSLIKWPTIAAGINLATVALEGAVVGALDVVAALLPLTGLLPAIGVAASAVAQGVLVAKLALGGISDALKVAGGDAKKFQDQLNKLTPAQRDVVRALIPFKQELSTLKQVSADALAPGLIDGLRRALPTFRSLYAPIKVTGLAFGDLAREAGQLVGSGPFRRDFRALTLGNVQILREFGEAGISLISVFADVGRTAQPLGLWLARLIHGWADGLKDFFDQARKTGDLARWFSLTEVTLSKLIDTIEHFGHALAPVFAAALPGGQRFLDLLRQGADAFDQWTHSAEGAASLKKLFADANIVLASLGRLVKSVAINFHGLNDELTATGFATVIDKISTQAVPAFAAMAKSASKQFINNMVDLATAIIRILGALAGDSGTLNSFVGSLARMASALATAIEKVPGLDTLVIAVSTLTAIGKITGLTKLAAGFTSVYKSALVLQALGAPTGPLGATALMIGNVGRSAVTSTKQVLGFNAAVGVAGTAGAGFAGALAGGIAKAGPYAAAIAALAGAIYLLTQALQTSDQYVKTNVSGIDQLRHAVGMHVTAIDDWSAADKANIEQQRENMSWWRRIGLAPVTKEYRDATEAAKAHARSTQDNAQKLVELKTQAIGAGIGEDLLKNSTYAQTKASLDLKIKMDALTGSLDTTKRGFYQNRQAVNDTILAYQGLVTQSKVTAAKVVQDIHDQVANFKTYSHDVRELIKKGVDPAAIEELSKKGPDFVHALATGTNRQLQEYKRFWRERQQETATEFAKSYDRMTADMRAKIKNMERMARAYAGDLEFTATGHIDWDKNAQLLKDLTGNFKHKLPLFSQGGRITEGTTPTADDRIIRVSKRETVVSARDSDDPWFQGWATMRGIPGFASGGIVDRFSNWPGPMFGATRDATGWLVKQGLDALKTLRIAARSLADFGGGGFGPASGNVIKLALAKARQMHASFKVALALMEAGIVESGLRNLNYGDRDSIGFLQQRPSQGWAHPMNISYAAWDFLRRAIPIQGRYSTAGQLAQAVQRSAFPGRYDAHQAEALRILHANGWDRGGVLQPGLNVMWNGTGRREELVPAESGAAVVFQQGAIQVIGAPGMSEERLARQMADMIMQAFEERDRRRRMGPRY